jgi:TP901 family phage tail tape measure protein
MTPTVGTAYVDVKPDFSGLNKAVAAQVSPMAKNFGGQFGKALGPVMAQQSKHLQTFARVAKYGALGGAALAVVVGKDLVQAGAQFEKQMDTNAAISEANRKQMVALEKQALRLGKATFFSANQTGEAQAELIKGGLTLQQVLGGGLAAALSLAEAGQLELATAAETTVNAMKLFGLQGKDASSVADMLSTAANKTTADVLDFAMALKQGGSVTKLAGYDMNETVTVLEALAEAGIKNSDAGTSMKAAVIQLLKPSKKQAALASQLNLEFIAQNGHLKDAAGISDELHRATDGMTKAERAKTLATLAGTDGVRTLNALYERTPKQLEALTRANAKQGTAQEIARKKMGNLAGQIEQFKGSIETAEIQIYRGMAPALTDLAEEATKAANNITSVFEDRNLSGSEKVEKAISLLSDELGKIWDRNDMTEHLVDLFDAAIPIIAEHAGQLGFTAAKGFVHGFLQSDLLGKVVMGTWLLHFIGGKAAFVGAGRFLGISLGKEIATSAAATAATEIVASGSIATAAATASAGAWAPGRAWLGSGAAKQRAASTTSRALLGDAFGGFTLASAAGAGMSEASKRGALRGLSTKLGQSSAGQFAGGFAGNVAGALKSIKWGRIGGIGLGIALADNVLTEFERRSDEHSGDVSTALDAISKKQDAVSFTRENILGPFLNPLFGDADVSSEKSAAANLKAQYEQMLHTRVKLSQSTQESLHHQLGELDISKKTREQLQQMLKIQGAGARLGVKTDLGMDPKKLAQVAHGFDILRSGALTSMQDINKVVGLNMGRITSELGSKSKEGRDQLAENYRGAVVAIGKAMAHGDITVKQGLARQKALFREANLVSGDDPLGIARGFERSWRKASGISDQQRKNAITDLGKMAEPARQKAYDQMVKYGQGLVAGGKIPKQDLRDFKSAALAQFGDLKTKGTQSSLDLAIGIAGNFGSMGGAVANVLRILKDNTNNSLGAFGAKPLTYAIKAAGDFLGIGGGKGQKRQTGGFIVPGTGSGDTFRTALPAGSFIENREAVKHLPLQRGGLMPVALEPGERVWLPSAVRAVGQGTLEARNAAVPRLQKGGKLGAEPQLAGPGGALRLLGQGAIHQVYEGAKDYLARHEPKGGIPGLDVPNGPIQKMAREMVLRLWDGGQWAPFNSLETQEAGWNPRAVNPSSGAAGLAQALPPSKYPPGAWPYTGPASAKKQLQWMMSYIKERYGSPAGAWAHEQSAGWYQLGGLVQELQKGGTPTSPSSWSGVGPSGLHTGIRNLASYVMGQYPDLSVTSTTGGEHSATSLHPAGEAVDLAGSSMGAAAGWIKSSGLYKALEEGIHNPNLSVESGSLVSSSHWGAETWADHTDHIHLGVTQPWTKDDLSGKQSDAHSYKEDVPAVVYGGLRTGSLSLGDSTPKSLAGVNKELKQREREVGEYRRGVKKAEKENKPGIAQALRHNVTALEARLNKLRSSLRKLRFEAAKKAFSKKLGKGLGKINGYETKIQGLQRDYNIAGQFAEQIVGLEPTSPELPASASDSQREAAEKAYVARFADHVNTKERPAYAAVLEKEATWRNAILRAESWGFSASQPSVAYMERDWETKIRQTVAAIKQINNYSDKVAHDIAKWKGDNPKAKELPKWLRAEEKQRADWREQLPMLRFEDSGYREKLGEAREKFYPGGDHRITPPSLPLPGTGSLEVALEEVQGVHWPDQHGLLKSLPGNRVAGMFGGAIWDTQGAVEELGLKISQATNSLAGSGGSGDSGDSERSSLVEELRRQANQEKLVREIERKTFGSRLDFASQFQLGGTVMPPYAGKAHTGAIVPGPPTQEKTMVVKGGEGIFTQDQMAAMGTSTGFAGHKVEVNVYDGGREVEVKVDEQQVEAIVNRMGSRQARSAGRRRAASAGVFRG